MPAASAANCSPPLRILSEECAEAQLADSLGVRLEGLHAGRTVSVYGLLQVPFPVPDFGQVEAVLHDVLLVRDKPFPDNLLHGSPFGASRGSRSITSWTRWNRSRSFKTVMSKVVVIVPSSLYPRTCKFP